MWFNQDIEIRRYEPGKYVKGVWQEGRHVPLRIRTSVQPTSNNDMQRLPQGRRQAKNYALFTAHPLKSVNDTDTKQTDRVKVYGQWYDVVHVEYWNNGLIPHFKALISLQADQ